MRLEHFKCIYDPNWKYDEICQMMFDGNKCIAMQEKMGSNPHVHFQGYTQLSKIEFDEMIRQLATKHYTKKDHPNGRPVKRAKRSVDEVGFQYLSKEGHGPLYSQGFSDAELAELKAKSDDYVEELKNGFYEYVHGFEYDENPAECFNQIRLKGIDYYLETDRRPGPRFQKDCLWAMIKHPKCSHAWKRYAAFSI